MFKTKRCLFMVAISVYTVLVLPFYTQAQTTTDNKTATTSPVIFETAPAALVPAIAGPLSPLAQTRITNLAANLSNRMDGAVRRLENVHNRLQSRLNILESAGINMSTARNNLAEATTKIETAKNNLAGIDNNVAVFVGSNQPRANWQELKRVYLDTKTAILAAHSSLLSTLVIIENTLTTPTAETASTTATTTTDTTL